MQFLRTIFWVAIATLLAAFSVSNWIPVTLRLWGDWLLETYLPVPMLAAFVLGLLPYLILHRATRWSLQRKLTQAERQLAETRALLTPDAQEIAPKGTIPPSAAPIAVPPGVS